MYFGVCRLHFGGVQHKESTDFVFINSFSDVIIIILNMCDFFVSARH